MTCSALPRPLVRAAAGGATLLVLSAGAIALAAPASAHVTVNPREAAAGGYHKLSIRVPNESPTAGTVGLAVTLPTDTPLASVSVKPHAGWRAEVTRTTLPEPVTSGDLEITEAVTRITWTAEPGVRVAPGQFEEFDISVGPLPEGVETLSFPTTQTYDDGEVVAWDQPVTEGEEPEHPAPLLAVTDAPQDSHHAAATVTTASAETAAAEADSTDETARVLGAGGLAVGVVGVGSALFTSLAARRRRQA
jgi:periplasmic copper chaperone A